MNRVSVAQLVIGKPVESTFMVTRANLRPFSRGQMLSLKLSDCTGEVNAVIWDNAENFAKIAEPGKVVRVMGAVSEYRGEVQITIQRVIAEEVSPEQLSEFVPSTTRDREEMKEEILTYQQTLNSEQFKALWDKFFEDEKTWNGFTLAPGGKKWHHAFLGGLMEHTCAVLNLVDFFSKTYPGADRDVLLSGALFHDIGKTQELKYDTNFDYTTEGRLIGHLVIGHDLVWQYAREIEGFPEDRLLVLRHLILSHHDDLGGSPVVSMTREAFLLHHADSLDSQYNAVCREMQEAAAVGNNWSGFVRLLERQLYLGPCEPWEKDGEGDTLLDKIPF